MLPKNAYHAKQVVCLLGLDVEKIHACGNDSILFRGEDADLEACRIYNAPQYKRNVDDIQSDGVGVKRKKKRPPLRWFIFPYNPPFEAIVC